MLRFDAQDVPDWFDSDGDFYLIQFHGPIRPEWLRSLDAGGVELLQYIHPFTYVVWADAPSLSASRAQESVRRAGALRPEVRVTPDQTTLSLIEEPVILAVSRHAYQRRIAGWLQAHGGEVLETLSYTAQLDLIKALVPGDRFLDTAQAPGVYTLQRGMRMQTRGEMSNQSIVGNYGQVSAA